MNDDDLFTEMLLLQDRLALRGEDEPMTREAEHVASSEFRRLAEELRESWRTLAAPPTRPRRLR